MEGHHSTESVVPCNNLIGGIIWFDESHISFPTAVALNKWFKSWTHSNNQLIVYQCKCSSSKTSLQSWFSCNGYVVNYWSRAFIYASQRKYFKLCRGGCCRYHHMLKLIDNSSFQLKCLIFCILLYSLYNSHCFIIKDIPADVHCASHNLKNQRNIVVNLICTLADTAVKAD